MNVINFFSNNSYFFLPTSSNPKVALVVNSKVLAKNSFKLYNPFSVKAIFFKKTAYYLFTNFNLLFRNTFPIIHKKKGDYIRHLEYVLNTKLVASVYFATAKDKVVLQLQSDSKIIGYVKYPLNEKGVKHINTEINAIDLLSKKNIVSPILLSGKYNQTPYLILQEVDGEISTLDDQEIKDLLEKFKTNQSRMLKDHPRVIQLLKKLKEQKLQPDIRLLEQCIEQSKISYAIVNEHGDFAPWNIINCNGKYIPIDFEFFEENGIEYFDIIKYYFQIGRLLNRLKNDDLYHFISTKIIHSEFEILFTLFLLKEIQCKIEESEDVSAEKEMLQFLNNGKL